jgi:acid stress-induced BolA-like protein IbaG/YrbA
VFSVEKIKSLIEKGLPGAQVEVKDSTGTSDHFDVVVVAAQFEGQNAVARHRLVYGTLSSAVGNEIHALSLRTLTPTESGRK